MGVNSNRFPRFRAHLRLYLLSTDALNMRLLSPRCHPDRHPDILKRVFFHQFQHIIYVSFKQDLYVI